MKIKEIKIKSKVEFEQSLLAVARSIDRGKKAVSSGGEFFESLDAVRSVLTDKRLDLWRAIRDQKPESITALSKIVGRPFRGVFRDLKLLETVGLVTFKKRKGLRGDLQHPISLADELRLKVA